MTFEQWFEERFDEKPNHQYTSTKDMADAWQAAIESKAEVAHGCDGCIFDRAPITNHTCRDCKYFDRYQKRQEQKQTAIDQLRALDYDNESRPALIENAILELADRIDAMGGRG